MKVYHDRTYLDLIRDILSKSVDKENRTGTRTLSVFGREMRFPLQDNIVPILTTKKIHLNSIVHELLWYLKGDTNIEYLNKNGVRIWDEWADEDGNLGPVYGKQWRDWGGYNRYQIDSNFEAQDDVPYPGIDQIKNVIDLIKTDPNSRRMIVSAWNVGDLENMALPPCHAFFQFYVENNSLSCKLTQRSADVGLGVPFNIAQYSILVCMIAHVTGLRPGEFIWSGGDVHIYQNHVDALSGQLCRRSHPSPTLWLNPEVTDIDNFTYDDIRIENYESHPTIKMEVSV